MTIRVVRVRRIVQSLLPLSLIGLLSGCGAEAVGGRELSWGSDPISCDVSTRPDTEECNGRDDNCDGIVDRDLVISECTERLVRYVGELAGAQSDTKSTERVNPLGCPKESGLGEAVRNVYSFTGPLPTACNRMIADDCADPARKNYWVMVLANQLDPSATTYQVMWAKDPSQYQRFYGCAPDGFDGPGSRIPKNLQPLSDVNGDGKISDCIQHHSGKLWFEYGDPASPTRVRLKDITAVRSPRVTSKAPLSSAEEVLSREQDQPTHLAVDVRLHDGVWMPVRLNADFQAPHLRWKQVLRCQ